MILLNILFGLFYYLRLPLIERFKDNELPWPWEGNPGYWRQIRRAILLNLFNHVVMGGVLGFFSFKNKFLSVPRRAERDSVLPGLSRANLLLRFVRRSAVLLRAQVPAHSDNVPADT
jgi:hypothetical protein